MGRPQARMAASPNASAHLRTDGKKARTSSEPQAIQNIRETGAGEGIRTLDPNLGKVVLYP